MRKVSSPARSYTLASILGLVAASVVCLCGGALIAVSHEGLVRLAFAGGGFAAYLCFFAHALRRIFLPRTFACDYPGPDGEARRVDLLRSTGRTAAVHRAVAAAALTALFTVEGKAALSQTATLKTSENVRLAPSLILKLESQHDGSSASGFGRPNGPQTKRDEFPLVLGTVATF